VCVLSLVSVYNDLTSKRVNALSARRDAIIDKQCDITAHRVDAETYGSYSSKMIVFDDWMQALVSVLTVLISLKTGAGYSETMSASQSTNRLIDSWSDVVSPCGRLELRCADAENSGPLSVPNPVKQSREQVGVCKVSCRNIHR